MAVILHPTDFSSGADDAQKHAARLARALGAELVLLHVVPETILIPGADLHLGAENVARANEGHRRWAEENLETRVKSLQASGLRARSRLAVGAAVEEINRAAQSEGAELIVMGTHGRGAVGRVFLGSVAARVVQTAPCPVLTVRER